MKHIYKDTIPDKKYAEYDTKHKIEETAVLHIHAWYAYIVTNIRIYIYMYIHTNICIYTYTYKMPENVIFRPWYKHKIEEAALLYIYT